MTATSPREAGSRFALWVAFFEIYKERVYDLLQPSICSKSNKRASLRVCDDGAGNAYVKGLFRERRRAEKDGRFPSSNAATVFADLRWINIQNLGEASKLLQYGNKNRSAAATKMNQSSSRRQELGFFSHSVFFLMWNLALVHLQPQHIYHEAAEDR